MTTDNPVSDPPAMRGRRGRRRKRQSWWRFLLDVLVIILIAVVVSFLVKTFLVRSFFIPSGSMENTLMKDDRILVDEITPDFGGYSRGDIVVFQDPGGWLPPATPMDQSPFATGVDWVLSIVGLTVPDSDEHLIKRIVGLPGDMVACCTTLGQLTVNGVAVDESSYLKLPAGSTLASQDPFEVEVPSDSLWVLGDNRNSSRDSRYNTDQPTHGFVPLEKVVGRAFLITWPLNRFGTLDFHHDEFLGVPGAD